MVITLINDSLSLHKKMLARAIRGRLFLHFFKQLFMRCLFSKFLFPQTLFFKQLLFKHLYHKVLFFENLFFKPLFKETFKFPNTEDVEAHLGTSWQAHLGTS